MVASSTAAGLAGTYSAAGVTVAAGLFGIIGEVVGGTNLAAGVQRSGVRSVLLQLLLFAGPCGRQYRYLLAAVPGWGPAEHVAGAAAG